MPLTNSDVAELTNWRRLLHQSPDLSAQEGQTAQTVAAMLRHLNPDQIITGLGGQGVAAVFNGTKTGTVAGPTILFRAELDALPITEISDLPYRSRIAGLGHMCGHDGHMTILAGLGRLLARQRPARGRVILLFQPAEEVGTGAAAVIADPRFATITPDYAFALHNLPGLALGQVALVAGPVNCASRGLKIVLTGKTSHASVPEAGVSPALSLSRLTPALMALGPGGEVKTGFQLVTVTHARLGEPTFGIAPGQAELWATLRTLTDGDMAKLMASADAIIQSEAARSGLQLTHSSHDSFAACHNDPDATAVLTRAITSAGLPITTAGLPLRASEDFGLFGNVSKSAMFYLGSGVDHPMLHNPDFDFPDPLIGPGVEIFHRVLGALLD